MRVCDEYAERNDIVIVDRYIDRAMTGTNDNRKDFQRMLKDSNKKAWDVVLVYKFDRFSRNKYETAIHKKTLKDNGIKLISATENIPDSPEGIILESMLEGMAEYYSAELSQKVSRGMRESRLKGQFTGGKIPYGFKVENKKVYIDDDEAHIVRYIYSQYANDVFVKDILANLKEKGITNRGKPFAKTTVYNLLQNEKYSGIVRHGEDIFDNIYPRIVPKDIFDIVRKKAEQNHFGKHDSSVQYILKNKIRCGYCGKSIISETGTARDGSVRRYYKCNGRKLNHNCNKSIIQKEILEEIIIKTTIKVLYSPQNLSEIADKILTAQIKKETDNSVVNILTKEIQEIQKSLNNILAAIEKGIVNNTTKNRMEELELQLEEKQEKLLIEKSREKVKITKAEIVKHIKTALKKEPKQMINLLVNHIILYDDKVEIYYNYTDKRRPDDDDHQVFLFYSETFEKTYSYEKFKFYINENKTYYFGVKMQVELYI